MTRDPARGDPLDQKFRLNRAMNAEQNHDYVAALTTCRSVNELQALVTAYRELALDAVPVVQAMTATEFRAFRRGLAQERRGRFAGPEWAERFGAVLMPQPMLTITQIAAQFVVPFGVAWARCRDLRPDLLEIKSARPAR